MLARGKIIYFATIMDTNRDSAHQSQNEDNFPTFFLGLEFLNEAEKEKNNGKGDSASVPSLNLDQILATLVNIYCHTVFSVYSNRFATIYFR